MMSPSQFPDKHSSTMGPDDADDGWRLLEKQSSHHHIYGDEEEWGDSGLLFSSESQYEQQLQVRMFEEIGCLNELYLDIVSPPFHSCYEETDDMESGNIYNLEPNEETTPPVPPESLQLLSRYRSRLKSLIRDGMNVLIYEDDSCGKKLATNAIIRLAAAKFIQETDKSANEISVLNRPFPRYFDGLTEKDKKGVELVYRLLSSAEKVDEKQFDLAQESLAVCDGLSNSRGNPVERLVHYLSGALREIIDEQIDGESKSGNKSCGDTLGIVDDATMSPDPAIIAFLQKAPFTQVVQSTGMQAILDHVSGEQRINIIDLAIKNGTHYTFLMQALASRNECPVEQLKIVAVGTKSKQKIEETGRRLMSFAETLNLNLSYDVVMVDDILDLNETMFTIDPDEVVAVYSAYNLMSMIGQPNRLESLMAVLKRIDPTVVVVAEVEGNHNSPVFVNRFTETLFSYGAFFDCLEDCMKDDESNRTVMESFYFSPCMKNIVAAEGEERTVRHVNTGVWRAFFARCGMVEIELSLSAVCQANMVLTSFACGGCCTLTGDEKRLLIGWKGTPLFSLSTWQFM